MKNEIANPLHDTEKIDQILKWMLAGESEFKICQAIADNWPLCEAGPLIQAAVDELQKSSESDPDIVNGWCFQATRFLYNQMIQVGDFSGALRAVKQMSDLTKRSTVERVGNVRTSYETENTEDADTNGDDTETESGPTV